MDILQFIFWLLFFLLFYTYLGYPIVSILIAALRKKEQFQPFDEFPSVTIVVAAHNEEDIIESKIENLLKLDYPQDKYTILVASDGSTDRTNELVESYKDKNVVLLNCMPRHGKTNAMNLAVHASTTEIIVFTDAEPLLDRSSLKRLIAPFAHPKTGMVCGNSLYGKGESFTGSEQEGVYWKFENWLKLTESRAYHLLVGGTGDLFAVRRELINDLPTFLNHDFMTQLMVRSKNYWVLFEPTAFAFSQGSKQIKTEYKRKVRIVFQSAFSLLYRKNYLNPFRYPTMAYQLWTHKVLRWLSFLWFFPLLPLSIYLTVCSSFYAVASISLGLFWLMALFGWLASYLQIQIGRLGLPYYFVMVTFAALHGVIKSLFKKPTGTWNIVRHQDVASSNS